MPCYRCLVCNAYLDTGMLYNVTMQVAVHLFIRLAGRCVNRPNPMTRKVRWKLLMLKWYYGSWWTMIIFPPRWICHMFQRSFFTWSVVWSDRYSIALSQSSHHIALSFRRILNSSCRANHGLYNFKMCWFWGTTTVYSKVKKKKFTDHLG